MNRTSLALGLCFSGLLGTVNAQTAILIESTTPTGELMFPGLSVTGTHGEFATAYSRFSGATGLRTSIWGSLAGEPPGILREPRTINGLEQTNIGWNSLGITSNEIVYQATLSQGPGQLPLESLWREDRPIVVSGDALPGLQDPLRFIERYGIGCTDDGTPYFAALAGDAASNTVTGTGIFLGDPPMAVYLSGPSQPIPAVRVGDGGTFGFSEDGTRNIARIELEGTSVRDTLIAMDGAPLYLEGTIVREGFPYPPSFGLPGSSWRQLYGCGINNAGHYYLREYGQLIRDGQIAWSAGDVVDGEVLDTRLLDVSMNASGTIAHLWGDSQPSGPGGYIASLFLEGNVVLRRGDHVDWDGDGVRDSWARVQLIEGTIALGPDNTIYATARSRVNGVLTTALLRIANGSVGVSYCAALPNSTGVPAAIAGFGSDWAITNDLRLQATDLPTSTFGYFLCSQTSGYIPNPAGSAGALCLNGSIGRFQDQIQNSGSAGEFLIPVNLRALPQPLVILPAVAGQTWFFTAWFRDSTGAGTSTSNFSNGLEVTFR